MTVYLMHLETPLDRGVSSDGKKLEAGHYFERRLKGYKNAPHICPVCDPAHALDRMKLEES